MYKLDQWKFLILVMLFFNYLGNGVSLAKSTEDKKQEIRALALLSKAEDQLEWRKNIQNLYQEMKEFSDAEGGEISARHLVQLRSAISRFTQKIVPSLKEYNDSKIDFLNPDNIILFEKTKSSSVDYKFSRLSRATDLRSSRQRGKKYRKIVTKAVINTNDKLGKKLISDLLFQVTARLVSLENISIGLIPFIDQREMRFSIIHDLKDDDSIDVETQWHNYINDLYKNDTLSDFIEVLTSKKETILKTSESNKFLYFLLENNKVTEHIREESSGFSFFKDLFNNMRFMAKRRWDTYQKIGVYTLYQASKLFGNTVGMVQSRHGLMYDLSIEEEQSIAAQMRPLDVLFEKTPFRLTDRFIPGHFGHNAIWTGTEIELKQLGVWDHLPSLYMKAVEDYDYTGNSFQNDIRNGSRIIEALRPGVQINSLRHFLDIDDYAVIRARDCDEWNKNEPFCLSPKLKKEYLIKAFSQIGKDYDFAFDVNTEEKIVCSELLYRTYLDIDFDTSLTVGSYNISPDQVALQGDEEGDIFTPIILYHNGVKVIEDIRKVYYNLLHSN